MITWDEVIENIKNFNWSHNRPAGEFIEIKYEDYTYVRVSGGAILLDLIKLYWERFGCFPDEAIGEVLRDRAYKKWRELHYQ